MSLTAALPKLIEDIGAAATLAAHDAFMKFLSPANEADPSKAGKITADQEMAATTFATEFATKIKAPLANAIHSYTQQLQIILIPKSLVSPTGPVTGCEIIQGPNVSIV